MELYFDVLGGLHPFPFKVPEHTIFNVLREQDKLEQIELLRDCAEEAYGHTKSKPLMIIIEAMLANEHITLAAL